MIRRKNRFYPLLLTPNLPNAQISVQCQYNRKTLLPSYTQVSILPNAEKTTDSLVCVDVGCKCDEMMEVFGLALAVHSLSEQRFGQDLNFEYSVK